MEKKQQGVLTKTEKILVDLLSNCLFETNRNIPSAVDWEAVLKEAVVQAVDALVFLDNECISGEVQKEAAGQVYLSLRNNILVENEHVQLNTWMSENQIPYVILKGCASARYYPKPIYRSMGDVDFLVSKSDFLRAEALFEKKGYVAQNKNHICHEVFLKEESHLEMHFEPAGVPKGKMGQIVREYLKNILDEAVLCETEQGNYMVPSVFHHGLVILLHTSHHLTGEGIGLRHLCDWAVFVASMSNDAFCELFEEKFKRIGMWHFAQVLTGVAIRYLGCPEREWVGDIDSELCDAIMLDIFKGGNFGHKDYNRSHEVFLISNRGKEGIGNKSMTRQMIESGNDIVYENWPCAKKCKILLPFGWIFYGGRYVLRSLFGKRPKINVTRVAEGAKERRELYKKLRIFEKEET